MTDTYNKEHQLGMHQNRGLGMQQHHRGQHSTEPRAHQLVKAATAAAFGGSLIVLSGLILAGTVIALTVATPVLVIFSPVLVPAVIAVFLLVTGFLASGGFGVAAVTVLAWMYRYVTGEHPTGADTLDDTAHKIGAKGRDIRDTIRDKAEHAAGARGQHTTGAGAGAGGGIYT